MSSYFSERSFKFMRALARHNDREWFHAHKQDYEQHVRAPFLALIADLAALARDAGRTVIIVSHRLSTLVKADAIMVLNRGQIVDAGRHDELLPRCEIYRTLWQQQTRHL